MKMKNPRSDNQGGDFYASQTAGQAAMASVCFASKVTQC
jgi:hypothetical protein